MGDLDRIRPISKSFLSRNDHRNLRVAQNHNPNSKHSHKDEPNEHPDVVELHQEELVSETEQKETDQISPKASQQKHLDIEA